MSKRRKHDMHRRQLLTVRALLSKEKVIVYNVETGNGEEQGLKHWLSCKQIYGSRNIAWAVCDFAHHWTIYLAVFCQSQTGERYIKSVEIAPTGQYKSDQLADVMKQHHEELEATCNPRHVIGRGWIASPVGVSLTEEQADAIFTACGVWKEPEQEKAA